MTASTKKRKDKNRGALCIDTSVVDAVAVSFVTASGRCLVTRRVSVDRFSHIHEAVEAVRGTADVAGIVVTEGPGGFSHVRRGVALANALGFAWGVPVAAIPSREGGLSETDCAQGISALASGARSLVVPAYGKEPTITKKRY